MYLMKYISSFTLIINPLLLLVMILNFWKYEHIFSFIFLLGFYYHHIILNVDDCDVKI